MHVLTSSPIVEKVAGPRKRGYGPRIQNTQPKSNSEVKSFAAAERKRLWMEEVLLGKREMPHNEMSKNEQRWKEGFWGEDHSRIIGVWGITGSKGTPALDRKAS